MLEESKKKPTSKKATMVLMVIGVIIALCVIVSKVQFFNSKVQKLVVGETLLEIDPLKQEQVYVNQNQIVKVSKDSIIAYNLKGEEIWKDTLTLDDLWIVQRSPYLAVANRQTRNIIIFNDKGRQGEITLQNPIAYFSMNEDGNIAVIEELVEEGGHSVSTYTAKGEVLGGKRVTYIENGGFPVTAEISPNNEVLLISYINVNGPSITSSIAAMFIEQTKEKELDNIWYGLEQKDNLIYEIEFINDRVWASVGDKVTTFYTLEGKLIQTKQGLYVTYPPYLTKKSVIGQCLPVVATPQIVGNTVHTKETLYLFNTKGEVVLEEALDKSVTYFNADEKGVIIGQNKKFTGFNKMGVKYFEFNATQDIKALVYLDNKAIAIGKTEVMLLKVAGEEEKNVR